MLIKLMVKSDLYVAGPFDADQKGRAYWGMYDAGSMLIGEFETLEMTITNVLAIKHALDYEMQWRESWSITDQLQSDQFWFDQKYGLIDES